MLKCIIIDDEELARLLLKSYIDKIDFLELTAAFEGPLEAMSVMKSQAVDIVFLDIMMPDLKGTDFAKMIPSQTKIIFTTAYSEYALEGFELNAADYLLKPVTFDRFLTAVNKVIPPPLAENTPHTITVKSGYDLHKLKSTDILYVESDNEYVVFHTAKKKIMSLQTLKKLEKVLDSSVFKRVHRSYIVNKKLVTALKGKNLYIGDLKIPVSAGYYEAVKAEFF